MHGITFLQALLLGVTQGLTEFLPISSSGHLVLLQQFFGLREPVLVFDIFVHIATLLVVFLIYRREIRTLVAAWLVPSVSVSSLSIHTDTERAAARRLGILLLIANIPTAIIGLGFASTFEKLFAAPWAVGIEHADREGAQARDLGGVARVVPGRRIVAVAQHQEGGDGAEQGDPEPGMHRLREQYGQRARQRGEREGADAREVLLAPALLLRDLPLQAYERAQTERDEGVQEGGGVRRNGAALRIRVGRLPAHRPFGEPASTGRAGRVGSRPWGNTRSRTSPLTPTA